MDVSSHTHAEEHTLAAFTEKGILYVVHRLSVGRTRGLALEILQPESVSICWAVLMHASRWCCTSVSHPLLLYTTIFLILLKSISRNMSDGLSSGRRPCCKVPEKLVLTLHLEEAF